VFLACLGLTPLISEAVECLSLYTVKPLVVTEQVSLSQAGHASQGCPRGQHVASVFLLVPAILLTPKHPSSLALIPAAPWSNTLYCLNRKTRLTRCEQAAVIQ
jgi:hypothetical protein